MRFRRDIQGLRAVAVTLVVLDHVTGWPAGGFIGVDLFFVISGYLITQIMLREHAVRGRISLTDFYRRRIRRIGPAALAVLAFTVVLSRWALDPSRAYSTVVDAAWAAGFSANWRFALTGTDYLNSDLPPSPVQHYWSLAVEEQFYIFWPWILIGSSAVALLVGRKKNLFQATAATLVTVVILLSFTWSLALSTSRPSLAYFDTFGRAWELGLGGLLALGAPLLARVLTRSWLATLTSWLGLLVIAFSASTISPQSTFPGPAASWPVIGAALVVVAGLATAPRHAVILCNPISDYLGKISYSLYLWHWPIVILVGPRLQMDGAGRHALLIGASVLAASLSFHAIEEPVRKSDWLTKRPVGTDDAGKGALTRWTIPAALAVALTVALAYTLPQPSTTSTNDPVAHPGARALLDDADAGLPTDHVENFTPSTVNVAQDVASGFDSCHQGQDESEAVACASFKAQSPAGSIALVGDSHAKHLQPAAEEYARTRSLDLLVYTKSACPLNSAAMVQPGKNFPYESCSQWNQNVLDALTADGGPSVVLVSSSTYPVAFDDQGNILEGADADRRVRDGYVDAWTRLDEAGVLVVAIGDTPAPGLDVIDCIHHHRDELSECAAPRDAALLDRGTIQAEAAQLTNTSWLDLNDYICPADLCPVVIGGVVVYRDSNHLTASYARTLAPMLGEGLDRAGVSSRYG